MRQRQCYLFGFTLALIFIVAEARPPVQQGPGGRGPPLQPETNDTSDWNLGVEYNRYLQEVVQVLESDPEFRKKLENADVDKIRDGTIAHELEMVNHNIRSQLDVIKRRELERLRHLAMRQYELSNGIDKQHMKIPQHIEVQSPTFEVGDLKKLIRATTKDLEEADRKRREDFKRYEMEKKFEHDQRLNHIEDEAQRKAEEEKYAELEKKHRQHKQLNHPMTKEQLEEVWESQDHMRPQDWDPKTFFAMHDLNGDQFWDEDEIRVLFKKELDKAYDPNAPEDDMREREEEMERMREHVFKESDTDQDRLISFQEFLAETKRDEFEKDPGWETIDQGHNTPFTDEEFKAFEMQRLREIQGMINRGVVPEGYPYFGAPGAPLHPGVGQPYIPGQKGMQPPQFPGQGQQGMNVQPLRGEQNYYQPPPQFAGGQQYPAQGRGSQQQFGAPQQQQQQFGVPPQQQQQFGAPSQQQQQQFGGAPRQQFAVPQQQQQFGAAPVQQAQQPIVPQQQQVGQGLVQNVAPVASDGLPQQPASFDQAPDAPQPRGQPVLRPLKTGGDKLPQEDLKSQNNL